MGMRHRRGQRRSSGDTTVERLTYPRDPSQVHAALYKLLEESEVRD